MTTIKLEPIVLKKDLFDQLDVDRIIQNVYTQEARAIKVDFRKTTRTWEHKPKFIIEKEGKYNKIIGTSDDIYKWVSGGTKSYEIAPKRFGYLQFKTGYKAKSRVRVIASRAGGAFGPTVRVKRPVRHPGIKARMFDEEIAKKWRKLFPLRLQRAIMTELTKR